LKILLFFLLSFLISCAPCQPVAPPERSNKVKIVPQKTAQKPQTQTSQTSQNTTVITGISEWDNVLLPWLGTPYLYGGSSKTGTDCSGFVSSVYMEKEGMYLPRTTTEGFNVGNSISRSKLEIGDLVYFKDRGRISHVGIFVGKGNFIHASTSRGVTVTPLDDSYWKPRYAGARRHL